MSITRNCATALAGLLITLVVAGCERATIERGEYLVTVGVCNDCHTPYVLGPNGPEPDMSRMLSGHPADVSFEIPELPDDGSWWVGSATNTAFAGPWGVSYTANLTPDDNTGLGIWTEEMFVRALKTGRHMGTSRMIQPPMPWPWYRHLTEDDLVAIYRYLRTIPPIQNRVPDPMDAAELRAFRLQKGARERARS